MIHEYHNTTNLKGDQLNQAKKKAISQNERVLNFFQSHALEEFTPCEVQKRVGGLITSIRRAMSVLTKKGLLEKTKHQKEGVYGSLAYTWTLKQLGDS